MQIVFAGETAMRIIRCRPELADCRRRPLPPGFASHVPCYPEAAGVIADLIAASSSSFFAPFGAGSPGFIHCMVGEGWTRTFCDGFKLHRGAHAFRWPLFIQADRGIYLASPELAFVQATIRCSDISTLMLAMEAAGSYSTSRTSFCPCPQTGPVLSARRLETFISKRLRIKGASVLRNRNIVRFLAEGSASVQESKLALMLGLPLWLGGRGLGIPVMNRRIDADGTASGIAARGHFRADLCWPEFNIDVEYSSRKHHNDPKSRVRDIERDHALRHLGWTAIHVSEVDISSPATLDSIAKDMRRMMGLRVGRYPADYEEKRRALERELARF